MFLGCSGTTWLGGKWLFFMVLLRRRPGALGVLPVRIARHAVYLHNASPVTLQRGEAACPQVTVPTRYQPSPGEPAWLHITLDTPYHLFQT